MALIFGLVVEEVGHPPSSPPFPPPPSPMPLHVSPIISYRSPHDDQPLKEVDHLAAWPPPTPPPTAPPKGGRGVGGVGKGSRRTQHANVFGKLR